MRPMADPNCPFCKGQGYIFVDTGSVVPSVGTRCQCVERSLRRMQAEVRLAAANIPEAYAEANTAAFNPRGEEVKVMVRDGDRGIGVERPIKDRINLARTEELCARPLEPAETIIFVGPSGVGKTYLALALLISQIRDHNKTGFYTSAYSYIRNLQPEQATPAEQREMRRKAAGVDVLLLDDLGAEKSSDFARRELFDLLDARLTNGKATIITSNFKMSALFEAEAEDVAGKRIASRLREHHELITWPEGTPDYRHVRGEARKAERSRYSAARAATRAAMAAQDDTPDESGGEATEPAA